MAVIRTVSLLLRPRLVYRLPWRYIYTLIRTRRATTIATATLTLTIPLTRLTDWVSRRSGQLPAGGHL